MVGLHCGVYFYETLRYVSDSIARLVEVSVLPLSGEATVCFKVDFWEMFCIL